MSDNADGHTDGNSIVTEVPTIEGWTTQEWENKLHAESDLNLAFRVGACRNFEELQKTALYLARARERIEDIEEWVHHLEKAAIEGEANAAS